MDCEGNQRADIDDVAVEDSITLFVNDMRIATLIASPVMLRELCVGYLITERVVSNFEEIQEVKRRVLACSFVYHSNRGTFCPDLSC
jgi:formate dehydrogenase assembly factor FdhD